jgi:hypothetical protein
LTPVFSAAEGQNTRTKTQPRSQLKMRTCLLPHPSTPRSRPRRRQS